MNPTALVLFDHVILVEKLYLKKIIAIQPAKMFPYSQTGNEPY